VSKTRKDRYGNTREQKLANENDKLKRLIAQMRKQIARIDIDRSANVREIVNNFYRQEDAQLHAERERETLEMLQKEWQCNSCEIGYLQIILINKMDQLHYYRACINCNHRTKLQRYSKDVRGILKK
jgi:hypothetical protein